jgi:chorismate mutase
MQLILEGIMKLLTNVEVEQKLLKRLRKKADIYGREIDDVDVREPIMRIPVDSIANMYEKYVIPLTKAVEVEYLLCRLD